MAVFLNTLMALLIGFISPTASAGSGNIHIQDPWIRAAPPVVKDFAAYFEINNKGENPDTLVEVSSPAFDKVGIHRSVMHEGMAHMEQLKELIIPPRTVIGFQPGGLHLMLMGVKKPLHVGDQVPLTFTFQNGASIVLNATVRTGPMEKTPGTQPMKHSEHIHDSK